MKQNLLICLVTLLTCATFAAQTNLTAAQTEANYTKAIEGRTADILKILALSDTNKAAQVHDIIIAQYRALNAWHDANDAKLKAAKADTNAVAQIQRSLKAIHDQFLAKLAENLTPEQVDAVKDKMTYGKVQFTFKGYLVEYPNLPEAQQQKVLELLKEARELAMDGGSAEEKSAIFNKYKGKINNYLSKEGFHPASKKPKPSPPAAQ
jgi:Spy/CpxP family protein refolding chaperone